MATLTPMTHTQRIARFGQFRFRPAGTQANPERVTILGDWPAREIVSVALPAPFLGRHGWLNARAVDSFLRLFEAWRADGDLELIQTWNGGWASRFKRQRGTPEERLERCKTLGAQALSNHAWGTAFDLNAGQWPLGRVCPPNAPWRRLARRAYEFGWFPGMDFRVRKDAQHFEWTGLVLPRR